MDITKKQYWKRVPHKEGIRFDFYLWGMVNVEDRRTLAVIDIGSNSIKLLIAILQGEELVSLDERIEITRLSEGLAKEGLLLPEPMRRTIEGVERFVWVAREAGVSQIVVIGTMAFRSASNSSSFVETLLDRTGVSMKILSGDEESEFAFRGALSGIWEDKYLSQNVTVFDIGGGSTELVQGKGGNIIHRWSLPIGSVVLTEKFLQKTPVSSEYVHKVRLEIRKILSNRWDFLSQVGTLVGVGGTVTAMVAVKLGLYSYTPESVHGISLSLGEIKRQIFLYSSKTLEERCLIPGLSPGRADIILAGACIVAEILNIAREEKFVVSHRGLRHGVALHILQGGHFS
ncbi:hypothetical protein [Aminobacterium mobile]|uniref:Ppx/GppA phosphatase family protein n=1 Tax=Aminobacterium mobile TaxID=81467 RepID=UPI002FE3893A